MQAKLYKQSRQIGSNQSISQLWSVGSENSPCDVLQYRQRRSYQQHEEIWTIFIRCQLHTQHANNATRMTPSWRQKFHECGVFGYTHISTFWLLWPWPWPNYPDIHRVSKNCANLFLSELVKFLPILIGEVENECISHNFSLFAVFLPKIIKIGGNLTKLWQKQLCTVFLRHAVQIWPRYSQDVSALQEHTL